MATELKIENSGQIVYPTNDTIITDLGWIASTQARLMSQSCVICGGVVPEAHLKTRFNKAVTRVVSRSYPVIGSLI
jgi:hypothetical protein